MKAFLLVTLLALTSCTSVGGAKLTDKQRIEMACASAGAALRTLATVHQERPFTLDQVIRIQKAAGVLAPVCTASEPPEDLKEEVMKALEAAAAQLVGKVDVL